jgi:hypothetical protein
MVGRSSIRASRHPVFPCDLVLQNKDVVYNILFRATSETLRTIAADPKHLGAQIGFFAVLHTWGQAHVHMIVPGGGISLDGSRWVPYLVCTENLSSGVVMVKSTKDGV